MTLLLLKIFNKNNKRADLRDVHLVNALDAEPPPNFSEVTLWQRKLWIILMKCRGIPLSWRFLRIAECQALSKAAAISSEMAATPLCFKGSLD